MTWSRDCELFTLQDIFFPGMQTINNCRNWSHARVTWGNNVIFCLAAAASLSKDVACFLFFCSSSLLWWNGYLTERVQEICLPTAPFMVVYHDFRHKTLQQPTARKSFNVRRGPNPAVRKSEGLQCGLPCAAHCARFPSTRTGGEKLWIYGSS